MNYAILALNCVLKNSKRLILASEIKRRDRKNNTKFLFYLSLFLFLLLSYFPFYFLLTMKRHVTIVT